MRNELITTADVIVLEFEVLGKRIFPLLEIKLLAQLANCSRCSAGAILPMFRSFHCAAGSLSTPGKPIIVVFGAILISTQGARTLNTNPAVPRA